jgi:ribosomal protein S18 acetylase RimI-like enzyme
VTSLRALEIVTAPEGFERWDSLLALLNCSFAYMVDRIDPPSSMSRLDLQGLRAKALEETLIVGLVDGEPRACAFAKVSAPALYVGKVAVDAQLRGLGVARRLFAAAEALARADRLDYLELQTRVELVENHHTFAALGFEKCGESAHAGYHRATSITMRKRVLPWPSP